MSIAGSRKVIQSPMRTPTIALMAATVVAALFTCQTHDCSAQAAKEKANQRNVAFVVTKLLKNEHLSRQPIDDTISKRAFEIFLDQD